MESNDTDTAGTSMTNTNGTRKQLYVVEHENAYDYPKLLLERILDRKRQNYGLESELKKLRKVLNTLRQEHLAKRLETAIVAETIELS